VPVCEQLEDRLVPSCSFSEPGGNRLVVIGDNTSNVIRIADNGAQSASNIIVQCDGVNWLTTSQGGIKELLIYTNNGNDQVSYTLGGNLGTTSLRSITVSLGANDDIFVASIGGNLASGSQLRLTTDGGDNTDQIYVYATYFQIGGGVNLLSSGTVGSRMELNMAGGNGSDLIYTDFRGRVAAFSQLTVNLRGGTSNDTAFAYLELLFPTIGNITAQVFGEADNDDVRLIARRQSPQGDASLGAAAPFLLIDGDGGFDVCTRTLNVTGLNCDVDNIVP
jgi:hypothetical protein